MAKKTYSELVAENTKAKQYIKRLQKVIDGGVLPEWKIPTEYSPTAGLNRWCWPLYCYLNDNIGSVITANIRNKACNIYYTSMRQFIAKSKYGLELPFEVKELDLEHSDNRKLQMKNKTYDPCCLCGFSLITAECHIIPRAHAGPDHPDNFVYLCPNHHHLFDKHRLSKEEFENLLAFIKTSKKMPSAIQYFDIVHRKAQTFFWQEHAT